MAAGENKLESIVTDVTMDARVFMTESDKVDKRFAALSETVTKFAAHVEGTMAKVNGHFQESLRSIGASVTAIGESVTGMAAGFQAVPAAAADAAKGVGAALTGIPAEISGAAKAMAPAITEVADAFLGIPAGAALASEKLVETLGAMTLAISQFSTLNKEILTTTAGQFTNLATALGNINTSTQGMTAATESMSKFTNSLLRLSDREISLKNTINALGKIPEVVGGIVNTSSSLDAFKTNLGLISESLSNFVKNAKGLTVASNALGRFVVVATEFDLVKASLTGLGNEIALLGKGLGELPAGIEKMKPALKGFRSIGDSFSKIGIKIGDLEGKADLIKEMGVAFSDLNRRKESIQNVGTALGAFGDGFKKMGNVANNIAAAKTNIDALVGVISPLSNMAAPMEMLKASLTGLPGLLTAIDVAKVDKVIRPLQQMTSAFANLVPISSTLPVLSEGLNNLFTKFPEVAPATRSLANIGKFIEGANQLDVAKMSAAPAALKTFGEEFALSAGKMAGPEVVKASRALSQVGTFLRSASSFKYDKTVFDSIKTGIGDTFTMLSNLPMTNIIPVTNALRGMTGFLTSAGKVSGTAIGDMVDPVNKLFRDLGTTTANTGIYATEMMHRSLSRMGTFLNSARKVPLDHLNKMAEPVENLFKNLSNIPLEKANPVLSAMNRYVGALNRMSTASIGTLMPSARELKGFFDILSGITVSPNTMNTINAMNRAGLAMKNMAPPKGGVPNAGGVGFNATINRVGGGGFGGIPPAAGRASSATNGFTQSLHSLYSMSGITDRALTGLKYSMLAFSVVGIATFAKLDNALMRTMAHMGDYDQLNRQAFREGIADLSGKSSSGAVSMAKALDVLTGSGMNATMALEALKISEDFAVASGMPLEKSTRRIVDIMNGMGLAVENVDQHYQAMSHLQDLIVGIAHKAGSTEEQLASAFTGRFMESLRSSKTSLEDGIALLGLYSRAGPEFRGAAGGMAAARAIAEIRKQSTENKPQWEQMLGPGLYDANGQLKSVIGAMERINNLLASGPNKSYAQLNRLGFSDEKLMASLRPMMRQMDSIKSMREEIEKVGGVTKMVADMIRTSIVEQLKILWNNAVNVATVFGDKLAPAISKINEAFQVAAGWFTKLHPAFQNLIVFGGLGAVALPYIARGLLAIGVSLASIAIGPILMLYRGFMALVSIPGMILSGLRSVASGIVTTVKTIVTSTTSAISGIWGVLSSAGGFLYSAFIIPFKTIVFLAYDLGGVLKKIVERALIGVANLLINIVASVVSLITWLLLLGPLISLTIAAFSAVGAIIASVVVTGALAIKSIFSGLVEAGIGLWRSFKEGATSAFDWTKRQADGLRKTLANMWEGAKGGSDRFFREGARFFTEMAGLIWNFRENSEKTIDWFTKNWEQAFKDVGNIVVYILESIAANIQSISAAVVSIGANTFKMFWDTLISYGATAFGWLGANWKNILSDMKMVLFAFIQSLIHNFTELFSVIYKQGKFAWREMSITTNIESTNNPILKKSYELQLADLRKEREEFNERAIAALDLRGPFDPKFMKMKTTVLPYDPKSPWREGSDADIKNRTRVSPDWKTDIFGFGKSMSDVDIVESIIGPALVKMGNTLTRLLDDLTTPWEEDFPEVKAGWQAWWGSLNSIMKSDEVTAAIAAFRKKFFSAAGDGEDGMNAPIGKSNPGNTFKQISLERTMLGGPVAEALDYQQLVTMQAIKKDTQIIAAALTGPGHEEARPIKPGFTNIYESGMVE